MQRSMLEWDEVHAYNAIHVVELRGALEVPRLRRCVDGAIERRGLSRLRVDRERFTYGYEQGRAETEVVVITGGSTAFAGVVAEMERQVNTRFDVAHPFNPFRFFVAATGRGFYLGLVYFHPVADASSVVGLLQEIAAAYQTGAVAEGALPDIYPDSRAHLLTRHAGTLARKLVALPGQVRDLRQSYQPRYRGAGDLSNGFVCFALPPGALGWVRRRAKAWGVTVNDLILALTLKSLAPCAARRLEKKKRRKLSLGCIVNVREEVEMDSERYFGAFLGSFSVTHEVPEGIDLGELARDICGQTSRIKRQRLPVASALELGSGRFLRKFFSPTGRKKFYSKYYPLMGGVTNMNLNKHWPPTGEQAPLDYFRGVSTGPITPLALTVTTFGEQVNLGLSYRLAAFSRTEIADVQTRFLEQVVELGRDF